MALLSLHLTTSCTSSPLNGKLMQTGFFGTVRIVSQGLISLELMAVAASRCCYCSLACWLSSPPPSPPSMCSLGVLSSRSVCSSSSLIFVCNLCDIRHKSSEQFGSSLVFLLVQCIHHTWCGA
uniref:Uncharacterized protein n=1 Tax=Trichobilharzia regenti TaxID=157069 RepID=A0AA85J8R1_TRIRE|nr:unnamed protein product [Trichobilharzia regenti]